MLNLPGYKENANQNHSKYSTSLLLEWLLSRTQTTTFGQPVGKRNPPALLVGIQICTTIMEKSTEASQ
jgi:hypothetical protein